MSQVGNLAAWLLDGALARGAGQRPALREGNRAWTFDELAQTVGKLSGALRTLKLGRGERILILMRDTLEAAAAILGVIHAGGVAVPVSELSTPDDLQEYVVHAGAVIAIVDDEHEKVVGAVRSETPNLREVVSRLCAWVLAADRSGQAYGLRLPARMIPPGSGEAHRRRCLEALALCGQEG